MTCIVAVESDGCVYMGGDSALSDAWSIMKLVDPKVFRVGDMLIGYCGSPRIGQLLQHGLTLPLHDDEKNDQTYLVIDVIDAIRSLLHTKGAMKKENDLEEIEDSGLLLGYRGKIYYVDADFQVCRTDNHYAAMGSGGSYALGSLHTTGHHSSLTPDERIHLALQAASDFTPNVASPFTIIKLEPHRPGKKNKRAK